ncbi:MAG: TonB-dependent receptor [Flavobacteriales bacterium]
MKQQRLFRTAIFLAFAICSIAGFSQKKFTISGEVKDSLSGEGAIGALIAAKEVGKGITTNVYGFYSLTLEEGTHTIEISLIGYNTRTYKIELKEDIVLNAELADASYSTGEVIIEADKSDNTRSTDVGKIDLEVESIKKLPVLLGEVDILKTLTLLPGVKSSGEGNAGFYVRGGGVDQNLILLDNSTVYNASHLFGFFSVFNADAVKNLELTKGGVPSNYGGRLASVLDISLKEGNNKSFHGQGGIGTIASRFTIEGPIKKDVSSFIISGRRTYIDVLLKPFINPESNFAGSGYYFYDLNAKMNYRLSPKDQLFVSGYFGRDVFTFASKQTGFTTKIPWGNATATARWNRIMSPKLFMNAMVTFTDYRFAFEGGQEEFEFKLSSGIRDLGAKVQWNYFPNYIHNLKWGAEYTHHDFMPNSVYARSGDTEFDTGPKVNLISHEMAVYALDEFDINENFRINAGLRVSTFVHVGPFTRYVQVEDTNVGTPPEPEEITYDKGEKVKQYAGLEPRVNMRYTLNKKSSIKAGFMRNYQYIHLTSLSPTSLPTDVWLPSTDITKPQIGVQYSAGYFRNFNDDKWESSVEVYYKTMQNQSEYKEGAEPEQTVGDNIDNLLVFGKGWSYGVELFLKKRVGKLNGWVGYTWSKTEREFEAIDKGDPFPTRWDRRHDVSFVANYKLAKRWDIGFVFVYSTGQPITLPIERYLYETSIVNVYGERNSFRMDPYHRVDLSATLHGRQSKENIDLVTGGKILNPKKFKSSWNFSCYNIYNRRNPYFIYFGNDGQLATGTIQVKAYQVSLFPVLPSVTWNFEF